MFGLGARFPGGAAKQGLRFFSTTAAGEQKQKMHIPPRLQQMVNDLSAHVKSAKCWAKADKSPRQLAKLEGELRQFSVYRTGFVDDCFGFAGRPVAPAMLTAVLMSGSPHLGSLPLAVRYIMHHKAIDALSLSGSQALYFDSSQRAALALGERLAAPLNCCFQFGDGLQLEVDRDNPSLGFLTGTAHAIDADLHVAVLEAYDELGKIVRLPVPLDSESLRRSERVSSFPRVLRGVNTLKLIELQFDRFPVSFPVWLTTRFHSALLPAFDYSAELLMLRLNLASKFLWYIESIGSRVGGGLLTLPSIDSSQMLRKAIIDCYLSALHSLNDTASLSHHLSDVGVSLLKSVRGICGAIEHRDDSLEASQLERYCAVLEEDLSPLMEVCSDWQTSKLRMR